MAPTVRFAVMGESVHTESHARRKPTPQPAEASDIECCECGDVIGPWWGDANGRYCRRHAPDDLRRPAAGTVPEVAG
jgi:hypothetical protein